MVTRRICAINLLLLPALLGGCGDATRSRAANESTWQPDWKPFPVESKTPKSQLLSTVSFTDDWLGLVPELNTNEQRALHEKDARLKEQFVEAFRYVPECRGATFMRTKPTSADFDMQIFYGLGGRAGKWQWVLYRTDTGERLAFGEEASVDAVAKNVCTTMDTKAHLLGGHRRVDGGDIEVSSHDTAVIPKGPRKTHAALSHKDLCCSLTLCGKPCKGNSIRSARTCPNLPRLQPKPKKGSE
jgi:hypothetical protein